MNRIALNFICKNESHIIYKMLDSAKPVVDLIVALDTGSTDDTIERIRNYGKENGIPTYVFERPFDNFGNSRNHALDRLRETVTILEWDPAQVWVFRMDCDETIEVDSSFEKEQLRHDYYSGSLYFKDYYNNVVAPRQLLFRLGATLDRE